MKKFLIAIFAVLYIGTSSGAVVHLHYCMGKLAGWGLGDRKSTTCDGCGMDKSANGCCKDDHKFLKNDSDQKTTIAVQGIQLLALALPVSPLEISSTHFLCATEENPISHAPPVINTVGLYIRNCVFLI
jgi:hypothetical protein